jgi:LysR family cyn operon transcriptional activator
MELRHIRYFMKAAQMLHFTHAAESLYVSQPTLSTHIQQLEEEVGLPLFDRSQRNVRLTQAGKIFVERGQRALENLDLAKERIADLKLLAAGTLRLASLLTFGQEVLPLWIATFNASYPNIRIIVSTGTSDFIEEQVLSGDADLGLSFVPPTLENLHSETLIEEEIFLVVNDNHRLAWRQEIDLHEVSTLPLALVSKQWTARRIVDSVLAEHALAANVVIEIDDLQALMQIVSEGNVAALLAKFVVANFPNLTLIPIVGKPLNINYGALWHGQGHLSPAASAFLAQIKQQYAKPNSSAAQ